MKTDASQSMFSEVGISFGSCLSVSDTVWTCGWIAEMYMPHLLAGKTKSCHCVSGSAETFRKPTVHGVSIPPPKLKLTLQGEEIWCYHYGSRTVNSFNFFELKGQDICMCFR